jgi:putative acetyltransferase
MPVLIRDEQPGDVLSIRDVNVQAFEHEQEANLVDALRSGDGVLLSLVAAVNERVVGHILFSPIVVGDATGAALAPMAVLPEHQRQGVGSELVRTGIQRLTDAGCPFVIVLGHSDFYPRFGFRPASVRGVRCEWNVPDAAFMMLVLDESKVRGVSGVAQYRKEFSPLM